MTQSNSPLEQAANITKTTCPYCGVGCGVDAAVNINSTSSVESVSGSKDHPANLGRLCVKGDTLDLTVNGKNRLLDPQDKSGQISWDAATETIAQKFQDTIAAHGPDSVAFYSCSNTTIR